MSPLDASIFLQIASKAERIHRTLVKLVIAYKILNKFAITTSPLCLSKLAPVAL